MCGAVVLSEVPVSMLWTIVVLWAHLVLCVRLFLCGRIVHPGSSSVRCKSSAQFSGLFSVVTQEVLVQPGFCGASVLARRHTQQVTRSKPFTLCHI